MALKGLEFLHNAHTDNSKIFDELQKTQLNHNCGHIGPGLSTKELEVLVKVLIKWWENNEDLNKYLENKSVQELNNELSRFISGNAALFFKCLTNSTWISYDWTALKFSFDFIKDDLKLSTIEFLKWFPCVLTIPELTDGSGKEKIIVDKIENWENRLQYQVLFLTIIKILTGREHEVINNKVNPELLFHGDKFQEFVNVLTIANNEENKNLSLDILFDLHGLNWRDEDGDYKIW